MKKSDLCQIADLIDEKLDLKFDEKFKNFATKDDLKNLATKDDLQSYIDKVILFVKEEFDRNTEDHKRIFSRLDNIDNELLKRPTKNEIFEKWDNNILQMKSDIDSLKYLHKDEWKNLPNRSVIKTAL